VLLATAVEVLVAATLVEVAGTTVPVLVGADVEVCVAVGGTAVGSGVDVGGMVAVPVDVPVAVDVAVKVGVMVDVLVVVGVGLEHGGLTVLHRCRW
jgi:hypothetical protein